jgi:sortase A
VWSTADDDVEVRLLCVRNFRVGVTRRFEVAVPHGDEIRLATSHGDLRYRVERTLVVEPDDLSVLEPPPEPSLTLITCFPFSYVGNAPRRFIVQASRVGSQSS